MDPSRVATPKMTFVPLILLIGCTEAFVERARSIAVGLPALVRSVDLGGLATAAAELRPFAFVLTHEVYKTDTKGFHELARDVGAKLVGIPHEEVDLESLEALLRGALADAEAKRG